MSFTGSSAMKTILLAALIAMLSASPSYADGSRGGHGGGHGGRWNGAWIVPALIGGALIYDLARPQTVYIEPAPIYVQPAPAYAPPSVQYWYFCAPANAYYPYVTSCPSAWQAIPATPPPSAALPNSPYGYPPR